MTLILASIRPSDVVMTSDGRSTLVDKGQVVSTYDRYQKLFPIPHHPVVLAHMGENLLGGVPARKFLRRFMRRLNAGNYTILQIADRLRRYAHPAIRARLEQLGQPPFGVNLWVAGFSSYEPQPRMIEVFWKLENGVLKTEERHFDPTTIVPGGTGQGQITPVDWHRIADKPIDQVIAYHRSLMKEAIDARVDHNSVGGSIHELIIKPDKWNWTIRPEPKTKLK